MHSLLRRYLRVLEGTIDSLADTDVELFQQEVVSFHRVNVRARLRLKNLYLLELNEALSVENNRLIHLKYRYHFQDEDDKLIFRYDNVPHFPALSSFPHHKHLPSRVKASNKPTAVKVINEAVRFVTNQKQ